MEILLILLDLHGKKKKTFRGCLTFPRWNVQVLLIFNRTLVTNHWTKSNLFQLNSHHYHHPTTIIIIRCLCLCLWMFVGCTKSFPIVKDALYLNKYTIDHHSPLFHWKTHLISIILHYHYPMLTVVNWHCLLQWLTQFVLFHKYKQFFLFVILKRFS